MEGNGFNEVPGNEYHSFESLVTSPSYNDTKADVAAKAIRTKNLGMRIMIDFHYSDNWADLW